MANVDKVKREKQANHYLLDAAGAVVDDWEKATGIRYAAVSGGKETGEVFDFQIPDAMVGSVQTMFALFGARTRAVNTASANRNAEDPSGISDVEAIASTFGGISDGDWNAERGGGGFQVDTTKLAEAIRLVKERNGQPFDVAAAKARLDSEPEYRKAAMSVPDVKAEYGRLTAKGTTSIDAL